MKRTVLLLLLLSLALAPLMAGGIGAGVFLGQPSGLNLGIELAETQLLDFKFAWDFYYVSFALQANYEILFPGVLVIKTEDIRPFVGVGSQVNISQENVSVCVHIPGGLNYRISTFPLEFFLELGLDLYLFPSTEFSASGGIGMRLWF